MRAEHSRGMLEIFFRVGRQDFTTLRYAVKAGASLAKKRGSGALIWINWFPVPRAHPSQRLLLYVEKAFG